MEVEPARSAIQSYMIGEKYSATSSAGRRSTENTDSSLSRGDRFAIEPFGATVGAASSAVVGPGKLTT